MPAYLALFITIFIGVFAQLLLKQGALAHQHSSFIELYFNLPVIVGFTAYFISALLYIYALKYIPLSLAYPTLSLSYFLVVFLSYLIWQEPFGIRQVIGLIFISLGVYFMF